MKPAVTAVIPARHASTRFPGKVLVPLAGRPLVVHAIATARAAAGVGRVIVATDDERVAAVARETGVEAMLTGAHHPTGMDRVAEVAAGLDDEIILNLQADEPLLPALALDRCVEALLATPAAGWATLAHPIDRAGAADPNIVKVVCDRQGLALYFSRAVVPHLRSGGRDAALLRHLGLYAYRRESLLEVARRTPTPLEEAESLEQLRALETGVRIAVALVETTAHGVDVPADLARVEALLARREATSRATG